MIALISFSGCGAKGAYFSHFETPSQHNSLVYVYRTPAFAAGGRSYDVVIEIDGISKPMGTMKNGGYFKQEVSANSKVRVLVPSFPFQHAEFETKAGETYCVKTGYDIHPFSFQENSFIVMAVDKETCQNEIYQTQEN